MNDNKLIAEFMGYPKIANDEDKRDYLEDCVKYHTSWDWLRPVVQKCYKIDDEEGFDNLVDAVSTLDIDATYNAVIEFIKTYNDESYFLCGSCGERCSEYTYSEDRDIDECNECKASNNDTI